MKKSNLFTSIVAGSLMLTVGATAGIAILKMNNNQTGISKVQTTLPSQPGGTMTVQHITPVSISSSFKRYLFTTHEGVYINQRPLPFDVDSAVLVYTTQEDSTAYAQNVKFCANVNNQPQCSSFYRTKVNPNYL
jgi:peroxiredoxin